MAERTAVTPAVMAKPRPLPSRTQRLLTAIQTEGGQWTTGRARAFYRTLSIPHVYESNARQDLRRLCRAGHLVQHGDQWRRRYYTLRTKDGA